MRLPFGSMPCANGRTPHCPQKRWWMRLPAKLVVAQALLAGEQRTDAAGTKAIQARVLVQIEQLHFAVPCARSRSAS